MRVHLRPVRAACLTVIAIASVALAGNAHAQEATISAEMQARGQALLQRLEDGKPIDVVVYGDSITDGDGTDGTHIYHRMFLDALRYRFPDCDIDALVSGNPGWTSSDALRSYDWLIGGLKPDLIVLQFGGNDRGWGRPLRFFRQDLARLLTRASTETDAFVIACLPPWAEEIEDGRWALAAHDAAAEAGVPVADFHRAIREGPHDFRGSFPYSSHPGSFTHVVMAQELMRAFDASTGAPTLLACTLDRGVASTDEAGCLVGATITSIADAPMAWSARLEFGREVRELQGTVAPGETVALAERFTIPEGLPADRAYSIPVRLWTRAGYAGSSDVAWLTIAPALSAEGGETWHALDADALVMRTHIWQGDDDLSGRFRTALTDDALRIDVEITDDEITVANLMNPSRGDSVEIYLDLRAREQQGRPIYSEDVLGLQIIPPIEVGAQAQWHNMHALPADLTDLRVTGRLSVSGYRVTVELPLAAIEARRGEDWGGIGLDVGVNDADGGYRKTQMMWAGTADNYVNPACIAGIYPGPLAEGFTRRILQ